MFTCSQCQKSFNGYASKGRCKTCYSKFKRENAKPARCHPDRKEHCAGLCSPCYRAGKRAKRAECHPDRLHVAKGLCRECYNKLPENIERARKVRRLKKYNLEEKVFDRLFHQQNGLCPICGDTAKVVDHCHKTGKVRGLLCRNCNAALGQLKDDVTVLQNAIKYLRKNQQNE